MGAAIVKSRYKELWLTLLLLALSMTPHAASASSVDLRRTACTVTLPDATTNAAVATARYRCGTGAPTSSKTWLWLRLDTSRLRDLPPQWHLLVDQTRFDRIAVLVAGRDGMIRHADAYSDLDDHAAPGGLLKFTVAPPGRDVQGLYLGFRHIDDLTLMRKIVAISSSEMTAGDTRWLLLMGLFVGTLLSALLYNLVIHTGQRYAFQRWYLLWVGAASTSTASDWRRC